MSNVANTGKDLWVRTFDDDKLAEGWTDLATAIGPSKPDAQPASSEVPETEEGDE